MDKTSMTLGWLVGRQIAGQRRAVEKQPIAYRYGDLIYPKIPEQDGYPYILTSSWFGTAYAYAFSAPLTMEPVPSITGGTAYAFNVPTPFLKSKLVLELRGHDYWSEWETVTDNTEFKGSETDQWVNHDVVASDGTTRFQAGNERTPVYLPLVIYDGEVTTDMPEWADSGSATCYTSFDFAVGDLLRITFNGVSSEHIVQTVETSGTAQVGNAGLNGNDTKAPDDGGDWLVVNSATSSAWYRVYFYTRTPGTYQLKIELLSVGQ